MATGTPEEIAQIETSYTGQFLRKVLGEPRDESGERKAKKKAEAVGV